MIFSYSLYSINTCNFTYKYKVNMENDLFEFNIDLINDFPNYNFLDNSYNSNIWYYSVNENNNEINGIIKAFDINNFKQNSYPRYIISKKIEYKLAKQYQYDKYSYILNKSNDNAKLYKTIYNLLISYYKNKYLTNKKPIIKETIV